mgnify:CR=1 FL=1
MKDSKEHILKTSLLLFLQKGFKEVTMNEIVKSSGFSKGAFYHYFSSKEEVFKEVLDVYFGQMLHLDYDSLPSDSLQSFYKSILDIQQKKDTSIRSWYASYFKEEEEVPSSNLYYILFDAVRMLPDFRNKQKTRLQNELEAWENVIKNAMDNGEIITNISAENLAKQFVYTSDGIALHIVMMNSTNELTDEVTKVWDSLYKSLKK